MQWEAVLCSRAAGEVSSSASHNSWGWEKFCVKISSQIKLMINHPWLERSTDFALHHQDELCEGLLSQKCMERDSPLTCGSEGPSSQKETIEYTGGVFFSMCKASTSAICCAKIGVTASLLTRLSVLLCSRAMKHFSELLSWQVMQMHS